MLYGGLNFQKNSKTTSCLSRTLFIFFYFMILQVEVFLTLFSATTLHNCFKFEHILFMVESTFWKLNDYFLFTMDLVYVPDIMIESRSITSEPLLTDFLLFFAPMLAPLSENWQWKLWGVDFSGNRNLEARVGPESQSLNAVSVLVLIIQVQHLWSHHAAPCKAFYYLIGRKLSCLCLILFCILILFYQIKKQ